MKSGNSYVFLAVTSADDWFPVDYAYLKAGKVKFDNVSPGAVCMVVRYGSDGTMLPLTEPFVTTRDGSLHFYTPEKRVQDITVARKYLVCESSWIFARQLINGFLKRPIERTSAMQYELATFPMLRFNGTI